MTYLAEGKRFTALTAQGARQGGVPELITLALR
jgi:hypothetical protein